MQFGDYSRCRFKGGIYSESLGQYELGNVHLKFLISRIPRIRCACDKTWILKQITKL